MNEHDNQDGCPVGQDGCRVGHIEYPGIASWIEHHFQLLNRHENNMVPKSCTMVGLSMSDWQYWRWSFILVPEVLVVLGLIRTNILRKIYGGHKRQEISQSID
jgi:hypothetical protein